MLLYAVRLYTGSEMKRARLQTIPQRYLCKKKKTAAPVVPHIIIRVRTDLIIAVITLYYIKTITYWLLISICRSPSPIDIIGFVIVIKRKKNLPY